MSEQQGRRASLVLQALKRRIIEGLFKPGLQVGIVSAQRSPLGSGENTTRKLDLVRGIQALGYSFISTKGVFLGEYDDSLFVWDIPKGVLFDLMAEYGQQSVIHKSSVGRRPVYYDQDAQQKVFGVEVVFGSDQDEILEDRTQIRSDPAQRFRIEFDWDHPLPWRLSPQQESVWEVARAGESVENKEQAVAAPAK